MFKLFGKNKQEQPKEPPATAAPKNPQAAQLAAQFDGEEFDLFAVTGANGFGGARDCEDSLWEATLPLTAWREEDAPITQGQGCLVALADDKLLEHLRRRAPRDSIIKVRVRQALAGDRFLLVGLPIPVLDEALKEILLVQTAPVSHWVAELGTFTLNRSVNWFQAQVQWMGQPIQLTYDCDEETVMAQSQQTAIALLADQPHWDALVRQCAAQQLLEQAHDWAAQGEAEPENEGDPQPLTAQDFMARMILESIQVTAQGDFEFWFEDGDLFFGHAIHVLGSLAHGATQAQMEG